MKPCCLFLSTSEKISIQRYLQKKKKKISSDPGMTGTSHECHIFPRAAHGTTHSSLFLRWEWALSRHYLIHTHTDGSVCHWIRLNKHTQLRPSSQQLEYRQRGYFTSSFTTNTCRSSDFSCKHWSLKTTGELKPTSYIFLFLYIQLSQAYYKDLITSHSATREDLTSLIFVMTATE